MGLLAFKPACRTGALHERAPHLRPLAWRAALLAVAAGSISAKASAQYASYLYNDTTIVNPSIPEGFDRGRNVSVLEQPRPDYDPIGIRVSSFLLLPRLEVDGGATDNVYLSPKGTSRSDGFAAIDPSFQLNSDWSRHQLQFGGSADIQRYFTQSLRDQDSWTLSSNGRLDIGSDFTLTAEADGGQQFESPYSGAISSTNAVLSHYMTNYVAGRGTYSAGRIRAIAAIDRTGFDFSSIDLGDGNRLSQRDRNRVITRGSLQFEYAFTPTVSVYTQASYDDSSYDHRLLSGADNRSSNGFRVVGGVNFDLASFLRGTVAVGYVNRNYSSALYKTVDGLSAEARVEYFPSDLTTITLRLRRFLEDSSIGSNDAYFDNAVSLRVDHELLRNLLLNASAGYGHVKYIGLATTRNSYRVQAGAEYHATRSYGLRGNVSYGKQTASGPLAFGFSEVKGQVGVFVQR